MLAMSLNKIEMFLPFALSSSIATIVAGGPGLASSQSTRKGETERN